MSHYEELRSLEARMTANDIRAQRLQDDFGALKLLLEKNNTSLEEMIELSKGLKVGLKLLAYVEAVAVWITKVVAAATVVWAAWKFLIREAMAQIAAKL